MESRPAAHGLAIAGALAGSWRSSLPIWDGTPDTLADIAPFLLATGAGGLAWARIRHSNLRATPGAEELHQAYRLHTLQAAVHEANLEQLLDCLRKSRIEPLVVKGWALARLYSEPGLRPYGDIDLAVAPEQLAAAHRVLRDAGSRFGPIDLHAAVPELPERAWPELCRHARTIPLGKTMVRILGAEDQLRHVALHLLRHGAWRPLWLCDVAVCLESLPDGFDWSYLVSGIPRLSEWALSAIGLAQEILGARTTPVRAERDCHAPSWLVQCVLHQWGRERWGDSHNRDARPILSYLTRPAGFLKALRCRWPNPIEAAIKTGAWPANGCPKVVFQAAAVLRRFGVLLTRLSSRFQARNAASSALEVHCLQLR